GARRHGRRARGPPSRGVRDDRSGRTRCAPARPARRGRRAPRRRGRHGLTPHRRERRAGCGHGLRARTPRRPSAPQTPRGETPAPGASAGSQRREGGGSGMSPTHTDTTTARGGPPGPRRTSPGRRATTGAGARLAAGLGAGALVASCALAALPAQAAPLGVAAVGAAAVDAAAVRAAAAADVPGVTVTPDPSYAGAPFEGWGTSLVWFANATGGYPDEIREKLADMVFGDEGLNLNIARYNVGGGNAPDVPDYLRAGGAGDGGRKAPEGTTRTDVDWWDAESPDHWDDDADATQRWWVDRIKDDVTHWETFSNSPPWFMTVSGYVSGGFSSTADQLRADSIDDFAAYLVGVTERLEEAHGIEVDTIDPFNEPNTNYWGTQLGEDGNPTGGRQEGAHMGPELQ